MEISLIRHGRSMWTERSRVKCKDFKGWIEKYDCNGVLKEKSYPANTLEKIATANIIMTSNLKRSIESARLLNPHITTVSAPLFREAELPIPAMRGIKLNPGSWSFILRCLWFLGYSRGCESLNEVKARAKKASKQLTEYAEKHTSVVLVGHGFFNMLIAKELQNMGWKGKRRPSSKHWNCTTYSSI